MTTSKKTSSPSRVIVDSGGPDAKYLDLAFTNVDLLATATGQSFNYPLKDATEQYLETLTPFGRMVIEGLQEVHGISRCKILNTSEVHINYGNAYEPREINPHILEMVSKAIFEEGWGDEINEAIFKNNYTNESGETIPPKILREISTRTLSSYYELPCM